LFSKRFIYSFFAFRGKGLGKEENGLVRPVQVEQKLNSKGIGFGTEGLFAPWWDDLYTKSVSGTKIKCSSSKTKSKSKSKSDKKSKEDKENKKPKEIQKKTKSKDIVKSELKKTCKTNKNLE
jgi:hypothetical protein